MKLVPLITVTSVITNIVVAIILFRHSAVNGVGAPARVGSTPPATAAAGSKINALQSALASGDPAALAAAGCPPDVIRIIKIGRAFEAYHRQMSAARGARIDQNKYWQNPPRSTDPDALREQRLAFSRAQRDFNQAVRLAYGETLETIFSDRDSRYAFLPAEKREQVHRIEQDYAELDAQINASTLEAVLLPSDREKLGLLRREKERDIAAALTPAEQEHFELHASPTADRVRERFGAVLSTEEDYKKIYTLQKAYDDQFNAAIDAVVRTPPEARQTLRDALFTAEQKLDEQIRAALTPEQLATLQRNSDSDRMLATALAHRLGLPDATADAVVAARERYASQSLQINANAALNPEERRTQLQELATNGQAELQRALGADGARAYAQRAEWLNLLKNGEAFSTNPKDAPNAKDTLTTVVFPVPAPGPRPGSGKAN
jgi:hypothetical protein